MRVLARLVFRTSPPAFCGAMVVFFGALLGLDRYADELGQLLLAVATWAVLLCACAHLSSERRAQVALVVVVATATEIVGSVVWGVYEYRLANLPPFVPPAHGLVYLTGLGLSECRAVRSHARGFAGAVLVLALAWTTAGLTILPRTDLAGLIGTVTFALFLLRGRAATIYAGVFLAVAALELYGTAIGTWRWEAIVPGLGLPQGNPPSGVASGYVLFDVIALALAPRALALARTVGLAGGPPRVRLESLDRACDRPVVVPAKEWTEKRREDAQEGTVGIDAPVEADVCAAVSASERPDAAARQVALRLRLDFRRRLEANDLRGRSQVIRQSPFEVLARDAADGRRPVGLHSEIDRLPPLRVGAPVG